MIGFLLVPSIFHSVTSPLSVVETDAEFTDCSRYLALVFFLHCGTSWNIFTLCLVKSWTENNSYFIISFDVSSGISVLGLFSLSFNLLFLLHWQLFLLWWMLSNAVFLWCFKPYFAPFQCAFHVCLSDLLIMKIVAYLIELWPNYTLTHIHSCSLKVQNNVW